MSVRDGVYDHARDGSGPIRPADKRLAELLGPAATRALTPWASMMGLSFRLRRRFVNGRSSATVAAVYECSPGAAASLLILKHDRVADDRSATAEFRRQSDALKAAGAFERHLAPLRHEPIRVGDGTWITFQELAGDGLTDTHVLTSLLSGIPGVNLPDLQTESVPFDRDALARVCGAAVSGILTEWAVAPDLRHEPVSRYLRRHLADRIAPGNALGELARQFSGPAIRIEGEPGPLPNPFALINEPAVGPDEVVPAFIGHGHGDLHTENLLVSGDLSRFWLIDLSRYRPDAPLSQDPVQLLLAIVNRTLPVLTPDEREALLRVLSGPAGAEPERRLPAWLSALIRAIRDAGHAWIAPSHLADEWRRSTLLSTVACSMILAARTSTPPENRTWLVRLAARSAAAAGVGPGLAGGPVEDWREPRDAPRAAPRAAPHAAPREANTGLAELCEMAWDLRRLAARNGRAAELEQLINQARLGHDIRVGLERLAAVLGSEYVRRGLPGLGSGPPMIEEFGCPNALPCQRRDERQPGGAEPYCHVVNRTMIRTVRSP